MTLLNRAFTVPKETLVTIYQVVTGFAIGVKKQIKINLNKGSFTPITYIKVEDLSLIHI